MSHQFKSIASAAIFSFTALLSWAQEEKPEKITNMEDSDYEFVDCKIHDALGVQNQYRSSTCWSFSSLSFLESELKRMGKEPVNLSEMFIVWYTYHHKAEQYVRRHGNFNFSAGGAFHDVIAMIKEYGIVPESAYKGNPLNDEKPMHGEMDNVLKAYLDAVIKNPNKELSPYWYPAYDKILDTYLGEIPKTVSADGKTVDPEKYAESLGVNWDDYIEIGSFSHQDYYKKFTLEVPDNWMLEQIYNVPLDDFKEVMSNAIDKGFTIAWGADISEKGFQFRKSIAVLPPGDYSDMEKEDRKKLFTEPYTEPEVTQDTRQEGYDNFTTQDDHGMHITGACKEKETGTRFYYVKNSWGTKSNDCDGYFYASEPYVMAKTISIMVHKDAVPSGITKKLGL